MVFVLQDFMDMPRVARSEKFDLNGDCRFSANAITPIAYYSTIPERIFHILTSLHH
jgi:hypothetical protein